MGKVIDITGQSFGMLHVLGIGKEKIIPSGSRRILWKCQCDCGNIRYVDGGSLRSGRIYHCGRKFHPTVKHGLHEERLYGIWKTMKARCFNPNFEKYKNYGARGIIVCNDWKNDFQAFHDWAIENGYEDNLTIERKDVNGNYTPENCCWIKAEEQAKNKTTNVRLEYNGETHILAEWAKITGISESELSYRIRKGWTIERTLTTKTR